MSAPPDTWAVIPVKPLRGALRRLTPSLPGPVRRALQVAMLEDVLAACAGTTGLAGVLVVTSDPDGTALARERAGAVVVADHEPPRGMNAAVSRGLAAVARRGAARALVLTADLPLARPEDLAAILADGRPAPSALLVPSLEGTGTNAMLLDPPGALVPRLGPDSLARHRAQAVRRGVAQTLLGLPRLALDIDTPRDLELLMVDGTPCRTQSACARLGLSSRLRAGSAL